MSSVLKTYEPPIADLDVLYEDAHLLAVSKPAGLLSVPGKGDHLSDCMVSRVQAVYPEALLIHRLDMDTSGVFLMARDKDTQANLGKQFERRKVKKIYIADVWGQPEEDSGLIDLPLRCDWPNRPLQMVCTEHGRPAQTKWRVLERKTTSLRGGQSPTRQSMDCFADARNDDEVKIARLELEPLTGRSHQLRVHLKEL